MQILQNSLLNAEISYTMYSILNNKWDSHFLTLNFRCFVSRIARKLTSAWVINSVIDICIFQVSITVFKDFSKLFHTYDHFQDFILTALKISTLNSWTFHTFPGSVRTLNIACNPETIAAYI